MVSVEHGQKVVYGEALIALRIIDQRNLPSACFSLNISSLADIGSEGYCTSLHTVLSPVIFLKK